MLPDGVIRPILTRLAALERAMPRVRKGQVTATNPLSVTLGGATVPASNVKALDNTAFVVGDLVSVLTFGNDMIVLGRIANGTPKSARGTAGGNYIDGVASSAVTVTHGLGAIPKSIVMTAKYTDGGTFLCVTENWTSTTFDFFVVDVRGNSHGPGNLVSGVFSWRADL